MRALAKQSRQTHEIDELNINAESNYGLPRHKSLAAKERVAGRQSSPSIPLVARTFSRGKGQCGLAKSKIAFTLSEALITIVILGILASISLPVIYYNVSNHYKKKEYSFKLQKFHNMIVSAMEKAEVDFNVSYAFFRINGVTATEAFKTYFADYIKYTKYEEISDRCVTVHLEDGSWFQLYNMTSKPNYNFLDLSTLYWIYYDSNGSKGPNTDSKNVLHLNSTNNIDTYYFSPGYKNLGAFAGSSVPPIDLMSQCSDYDYLADHSKKGLIAKLVDECGKGHPACCVKAIKENGWKYPDNYPYRI